MKKSEGNLVLLIRIGGIAGITWILLMAPATMLLIYRILEPEKGSHEYIDAYCELMLRLPYMIAGNNIHRLKQPLFLLGLLIHYLIFFLIFLSLWHLKEWLLKKCFAKTRDDRAGKSR
jgi:hypothetical protein